MLSHLVSNCRDRRWWAWLMLLLVLLLVVGIRIRLAPMPLERDEGEFALAGQILLRGLAPPNHVYSMKLPGVSAVYAVVMALLGQTATGIHIGLLATNLVCVALVLAIARTWLDLPAACFSAAAYAVLSLSPSVLGLAAHAEHFVVVFVLAGWWLQLRNTDTHSRAHLFFSGLLFGTAFLMKQAALPFVFFGAVNFLFNGFQQSFNNGKKNIIKLIFYFAGVVTPYLIVCFCLWRMGGFSSFWYWTVQYAKEYVSMVSLSEGVQIFRVTIPGIIGSSYILWILGFGCFIGLAWTSLPTKSKVLLAIFSLFSFLAVCPGFFFREHYFIALLPALSLFAGLGLETGWGLLIRWDKGIAVKVLVVTTAFSAISFPVWSGNEIYFHDSPAAACRRIYGAKPFPESLVIGKFLFENTDSNATIAVLGSEPQICFYARRMPATGYVYTYGLMEPQPFAHRMQEEMIHEIEASHPQFLVFSRIRSSWLTRKDSDQTIFTWCQKYIQEQFELVGLVDIFSKEKTEYRWGPEIIGYKAESNNLVLVYKRKKI